MEPDSGRLLRYLTGDGTPEDVTSVHAWAATHPRHAKELDILQRLWALPEQREDAEASARRVWGTISGRLDMMSDAPVTSPRRDARNIAGSRVAHALWRRPLIAGLAVVAAIVVSSGVALWRTGISPSTIPAQEYATGPAQHSTVHLHDGTTLILAPGTSVRVSSSTIDITGEVSLSIAHHTATLWVVRTSNAVVGVLGTAFDVRHYPTDAETRVVVSEGKVSVRHRQRTSERGTALSPHMMARVTDSSIAVTTGIMTRDYVGLETGALVFNRTPLRDIVAELARAYHVDIRIADTALANQTFRMAASVTEDSIDDVLGRLCVVADAHYTRQGHAYVVSPGRTASTPHTGVRRTSYPSPEPQYGR